MIIQRLAVDYSEKELGKDDWSDKSRPSAKRCVSMDVKRQVLANQLELTLFVSLTLTPLGIGLSPKLQAHC